MTDPVSRLVEAIDRKDAEGIRDAYAPDVRLVGDDPRTLFQIADGADDRRRQAGRAGTRAGRRTPPTRSSARVRTATAPRGVRAHEHLRGRALGGAPGPRRARRPARASRSAACTAAARAQGEPGAGRARTRGRRRERRGARRRAGGRPHPPPRRPPRHDGAGPARGGRRQGRAARRRPVAPRGRRARARAALFHAVNRDKRGIVLDLQTAGGPRGAPRARRATPTCSSTASRPGVAERLGAGAAELRPSTRAWSTARSRPSGPRGGKGTDVALQAESGLVAANGGRPLPVPVHDTVAPWIMVAGILAALLERERSGRGQVVETSLLEASAALAAHRLIRDGSGEPLFNRFVGRALPPLPDRRRRHLAGLLRPAPARAGAARPRPRASSSTTPASPTLPVARPPLRRAGRADRRPAGRAARRADWLAHPRRRRPAPRRGERAARCRCSTTREAARAGPAWWRSRTPRSAPSRSPARRCASRARPARTGRPAPRLGEHTDEVLDEIRERRS